MTVTSGTDDTAGAPRRGARLDALRAADEFERDGQLLAAIDRLDAANAIARDDALERRLLKLRHDAFASLVRSAPARWPPALADPFPSVAGPPEIAPDEVSSATVGGAIVHHGSVIIRHLVPAASVTRLRDAIDTAFAAHDEWAERRGAEPTSPWFEPFRPVQPCPLDSVRKMVRRYGALMAAESPRVASEIIAFYTSAGLPQALEGYFGERAVLSVDKFTLRRVTPDAVPSWHQDGAFMGAEIRSVNVWVALTDCGAERAVPGLDIVSDRIDELLPTGTEGAYLHNSIARPIVEQAAGDAEIIRPRFDAGDALIFDDRLPHATGTSPGMQGERYAIESWFFSPSWFPQGYVPLVF